MSYIRVNSTFLIQFSIEKEKVLIYDLNSTSELVFSGEEFHILNDLVNKNLSLENVEKIYDKSKIRNLVQNLKDKHVIRTFDGKVISKPLTTISSVALKLPRMRKFQINRLVFEITGECNLNCKFCTDEPVIYRSCGCKKWKQSSNQLKLQDYRDLINQAIKMHLQQIDFMGGEPLLKWNLIKSIIEEYSQFGIHFNIYTNGTLIDRDIVDFLKKHKVCLIFQLLGFENHYKKANVEMSDYDKIKENLDLILLNKISCVLYLLVHKYNETSIDDISSYYYKKGFHVEKVYLYPTNEMCSSLNLSVMESPEMRNLHIDFNNYQLMDYVHCCLNGQICISHNGDIFPCIMLREKIGNIRERKLWEIFKEGLHKKYWEINKNDIEHCKKCERKFQCFDCRALEYYTTKNLYGMKYCNQISYLKK